MKAIARAVLYITGMMLGGMQLVSSEVARAEALSMKFHVFASGVKAMRVKFHGDLQEKTYSGTAEMKPKGFAKLFIKKKMHMQVKGRFNDRHAKPVSFSIRTKKKKKTKNAQVMWDEKGRVVGWKRQPPLSAAQQKQVQAAIASGAIDPLSMLFAIGVRTAENPCSGKIRVFDGLTVYDIRLAAVRRENVRNMNYKGQTLKCRLVYVPVAGMSESKKRKRLKNPPVFTVWLARVNSAVLGKVWLPVQAAGKMKARPFTATLVEATLDGKPLRPAR